MNAWIKGLLGAGILGTLYSFRTYLGILLVLLVTTCSYRGPITEYITTSRDQAHQERMAELQAQHMALQLKADQELKILEAKQRAEAQARADELKREQSARADQIKLERERNERIRNLPPPTTPTVNQRINFSNGDYYIGSIANGARNGVGTYYWANGTRYEGNWTNDRRNGLGTQFYTNGTIRSGTWANDVFVN